MLFILVLTLLMANSEANQQVTYPAESLEMCMQDAAKFLANDPHRYGGIGLAAGCVKLDKTQGVSAPN